MFCERRMLKLGGRKSAASRTGIYHSSLALSLLTSLAACDHSARKNTTDPRCSDRPQDILLIDARLITETSTGTLTRVFDRESTPRFRVPAAAAGTWSIELTTTATAAPL